MTFTQNILMHSVYEIYLIMFVPFTLSFFFFLFFCKLPPNFAEEVLNPVTVGSGSGPRIIKFRSETSRTKSFLGVDQNPGLFSIKLCQRQSLQKLFAI